MTEEHMIDGRMNNMAPKRIKEPWERTSVLAKLRQKQREIAIRSGKQPQQMQEASMERKRK